MEQDEPGDGESDDKTTQKLQIDRQVQEVGNPVFWHWHDASGDIIPFILHVILIHI